MSGERKPVADISESLRAGKHDHRHPRFFFPFPARGEFVACKLPHADSTGMDPTWLWDQRVPLRGSCAFPHLWPCSWGWGQGRSLSIPRGRARRCAGHGAGYGTALAGSVRSSGSLPLPENIPGRLARGQRRGAGKRAFYGSVSALE